MGGDARDVGLAVAVPLVALAMLASGLAGAVPWTLAVGLAALGSAAFAWQVARAVRGVPFAAGLLVTAGCAGAAGLADTLAPRALVGDVPLATELPLVGLFFAVGGYLLGLLMPGERRTPLLRLRAWLDGASFGLCTLYTIWLLVIGRAGARGAGVTASLLGSIALGAAVVGAVHASRYRRRMLWYGVGAMLSIAGLTALVVTLDYRGSPLVPAAPALPILAAGPGIWYGSGPRP